MKICESFDSLWNAILTKELNRLNKFLDKYEFRVELVEDMDAVDEDMLEHCVGIFCSDIQDNASVFPIFINKDLIENILKERGELNSEEITDAIRGTLWHEAGHGLIDFLEEYDFEFDDEEYTAENFALEEEHSELADALQEYLEEFGDEDED